MSKILNNPFYGGVLKVKGKTFQGGHEPLIPSTLYAKVQDILTGKTNSKMIMHDFLFKRFMRCGNCNYALIGERQKGHIYYRCHTKHCTTTGIREECVEAEFLQLLEHLNLYPIESQLLTEMLAEAQRDWSQSQAGIQESLLLQQSNASRKLERLTDAYIENAIDMPTFESKKEKLLLELQSIRHSLQNLTGQKEAVFRKAHNFLELLKTIKNCYLVGNYDEKRKIMKTTTSNLVIEGKKPVFSMKSPFQDVVNMSKISLSAPNRNTPRTCTVEIVNLAKCAPNRNTPRTCTVEIANLAKCALNRHTPRTCTAETANQTEYDPALRTRMAELFTTILTYCESADDEEGCI